MGNSFLLLCFCLKGQNHFKYLGCVLQVERFWLQSDAAVCVLAGLGLSHTHRLLERKLGRGDVWRAAGWCFTAALLANLVHTNYR